MSGGPVYPACVGGEQHHKAEGDAVPGERDEGMGGDKAQQGAHGDQGEDEAGDQADAEHRDVLCGHGGQVLIQAVERGGAQYRYAEEEGEFGGGLAGQAEEQPAYDGGAGARSAGYQGQALRQADLEGHAGGDVVHGLGADAVRALFGPQDDEAAHDKADGHADGIEQHGFDLAAEQLAQGQGRYGSDGEVEQQLPAGAGLAGAGCGLYQPATVFPGHCQDGAQLDEDFVDIAFFLVQKIQQVAGQYQVAGAGDGQELGEALDDAHDERLEQQQKIHGGVVWQGKELGDDATAGRRGRAW